MKQIIRFGEAAGNTFILNFQREGESPNASTIAQALQEHNKDTYISISSPNCDQTRIRVFEQDESESDICGNALRVVGLLLQQVYHTTSFPIQTRRGLCRVNILKDCISTALPVPRFHGVVATKWGPLFLMDVGEPHAVLFQNAENFHEIFALGLHIVSQILPRSEGMSNYNLTLLQPIDAQNIKAQTFERGVNNTTLSCGTGSLASAVLYAKVRGYPGRVHVHMPGGTLEIDTRTNSITGTATLAAQ